MWLWLNIILMIIGVFYYAISKTPFFVNLSWSTFYLFFSLKHYDLEIPFHMIVYVKHLAVLFNEAHNLLAGYSYWCSFINTLWPPVSPVSGHTVMPDRCIFVTFTIWRMSQWAVSLNISSANSPGGNQTPNPAITQGICYINNKWWNDSVVRNHTRTVIRCGFQTVTKCNWSEKIALWFSALVLHWCNKNMAATNWGFSH